MNKAEPQNEKMVPVRKALTPEQQQRRVAINRRNAAISAGVKVPPSGIFGSGKASKPRRGRSRGR